MGEALVGKQRLRLRAEHGQARRVSNIERFNSKRVPGHEQTFVLPVVQSKGEHSTQLTETLLYPPIVNRGRNHFSVGTGEKLITSTRQLLAQATVVVYLAIKDNPITTVR